MTDTNAQTRKAAQTVLGPVQPEELGITLPHEHLLVDAGILFAEPEDPEAKRLAHEPVSLENLGWIMHNQYNNLDNVRLLDEEAAIAEALMFKRAGGQTVVDVTTNGLGRNLPALRRISQAAGLHVVAGTGYYVLRGAEREALEKKSEDEIAEEMVAEIMVGADGTDIRCGIIGEIGCSWPLEDWERTSLRASARAQARTGAAITIHPGRHETSPMEILRLLDAAGADLSHVVMGHMDRTGFLPATRREIAATGCSLEYDIFGGNPFYPLRFGVFDRPCDRERIEQVKELIGQGHLRQLLLSQDTCLKTKLTRYGGQGYAHILRNIVPQMTARGVSEEHIRAMMVDNPRRLLCFAQEGAA